MQDPLKSTEVNPVLIDFTSPFGFDTQEHPDRVRAADLTNRFINRYVAGDASKGCWRVIGGLTGTGKTMLSQVVLRCGLSQTLLRQIKESRKTLTTPETHLIKWVELWSKEHSEQYFNEYLDSSIRASMLVVIDGIGAEHDWSSTGVDRLLKVLELCEKKWLFATTSLNPDWYAGRYGDRVASLLRRAVSVWIDAPDYRLKGRL